MTKSSFTPRQALEVLRLLGNNKRALCARDYYARSFSYYARLRYRVDQLVTTLIKLHSTSIVGNAAIPMRDQEELVQLETRILRWSELVAAQLQAYRSGTGVSARTHLAGLSTAAPDLFALCRKIEECEVFTRNNIRTLKPIKLLIRFGSLNQALHAKVDSAKSGATQPSIEAPMSRLRLILEKNLLSFTVNFQSPLIAGAASVEVGALGFKSISCVCPQISEQDCLAFGVGVEAFTKIRADYLKEIKEASDNFSSVAATSSAISAIILREVTECKNKQMDLAVVEAIEGLTSKLSELSMAQKEKILAALKIG